MDIKTDITLKKVQIFFVKEVISRKRKRQAIHEKGKRQGFL